MSTFNFLGMRNGFPFALRSRAEDGQPFEQWDGETFDAYGSPTKSTNANGFARTVYGPGSLYCLKLTFAQLIKLYWQVKGMTASMSGDAITVNATATASLNWTARTDDVSELVAQWAEYDAWNGPQGDSFRASHDAWLTAYGQWLDNVRLPWEDAHPGKGYTETTGDAGPTEPQWPGPGVIAPWAHKSDLFEPDMIYPSEQWSGSTSATVVGPLVTDDAVDRSIGTGYYVGSTTPKTEVSLGAPPSSCQCSGGTDPNTGSTVARYDNALKSSGSLNDPALYVAGQSGTPMNVSESPPAVLGDPAEKGGYAQITSGFVQSAWCAASASGSASFSSPFVWGSGVILRVSDNEFWICPGTMKGGASASSQANGSDATGWDTPPDTSDWQGNADIAIAFTTGIRNATVDNETASGTSQSPVVLNLFDETITGYQNCYWSLSRIVSHLTYDPANPFADSYVVGVGGGRSIADASGAVTAPTLTLTATDRWAWVPNA